MTIYTDLVNTLTARRGISPRRERDRAEEAKRVKARREAHDLADLTLTTRAARRRREKKGLA